MRFCGRPHLGWFYICPDIVLYQKEEEKGNSTKGVLTKPGSCHFEETFPDMGRAADTDHQRWHAMAQNGWPRPIGIE
jgi:hypothetical protein